MTTRGRNVESLMLHAGRRPQEEEQMSTNDAGETRCVYWMALGTFAVGTEGFMIAPLLPALARDLHVGIVAAGQLVTVFTLTYAFGSPVLTALTGAVRRRRLLIASMAGFAVANVLAAMATDFWLLMTARVLAALAAGLYVPNANALAGAVVAPEKRGTALAIVTAGTSIAVAFGVPVSALIGDGFGWRLTFVMVAAYALVATTGLSLGLAPEVGAGLPVTTLRERAEAALYKPVLLALLATLLWATAAYTAYTYLAVFLSTAAQIDGPLVGLVLFLWGAAAAAGVTAGGALSDRLGPRRVIVASLSLLAAALAMMSGGASFLPPWLARVPIFVAIVVWGLSAWAFFPAQQARLIGIVGVKLAPIVLSLNASVMYAGFALGAALGSVTVARLTPAALGWSGAASAVTAIVLILATYRTNLTSEGLART
jgi:predicted MFS family arabinose efflux permease